MKTVAFFNNKSGVGKTSLVYHLAAMFEDLGQPTVAVDLDPQSNLTSMFLTEERLVEVWPDGDHPLTIAGSVQPIISGIGDIKEPHIENVSQDDGEAWLVIGDLNLSRFEDYLSNAWPRCLDRQEGAFRIISAFHRITRQATLRAQAELVLIDVGPNLGAINRAALIAADFVVIPLAPDLFSLQGLRNLGPTLRMWRSEWQDRLARNPTPNLDLPAGTMEPVGYVVMQHAVRLDRPVRAYERWARRIPGVYREAVLDEPDADRAPDDDPHRLALLNHFRSLMPMAMEAHKPMFRLKPADGALGAHAQGVQIVRRDFRDLAERIAARIGLILPAASGA